MSGLSAPVIEAASAAVIAAASAGILGSAWNSGGTAMLSLLGIPGLLSDSIPPQALAKQWEGIYTRGKALGPQMAMASMLGYAYLIYDRRSKGQSYSGYVAAAALSLGIMPYTIIFMMGTNNALLGVASGATKTASESAVRELLVRWKGLNLLRSVFPFIGGILGIWTLVGGVQ